MALAGVMGGMGMGIAGSVPGKVRRISAVSAGVEVEWRKVSSTELGISNSMIDKPTRAVLKSLRTKGFLVYLVGGCVRDLILNRTPKDFDVITSARLHQVVNAFSRCEIVGRRFPICHVHFADSIVEVSSFSTVAKHPTRNSNSLLRKPPGCTDHDFIRWRNCVQRDFTINGLMFDPYTRIVYDYIGGIEDIKKSRVKTVIPAGASFTEDCARILRAFRIAARLGFKFTKEITSSLKELSYSIMRLDKGRILMEMNYMLAFGSAEASLRLLWKYGLLEILLPLQAAYFVSQGFRRRDKRSNLLLSLFSTLDRLLAPDRPCHSSLWISILAFHKALADQPRDPLVIATFCLALHNGGTLSEAIRIARSISRPYDPSFQEVVKTRGLEDKNLMVEVKDLAASVKSALSKMTDESIISQAMAKYPQAPSSDLVFISLALQLKTDKIVSCIVKGRERGFVAKHGSKINYEALAAGSLHEIRYMLSRIIFDTVYPPHLNNHERRVNGNSR
ncbi:hypothetical protein vseg_002249 [Gypsophila vaccaria]